MSSAVGSRRLLAYTIVTATMDQATLLETYNSFGVFGVFD